MKTTDTYTLRTFLPNHKLIILKCLNVLLPDSIFNFISIKDPYPIIKIIARKLLYSENLGHCGETLLHQAAVNQDVNLIKLLIL